ncbi:MAG: MFS transporter [Acidimicrobiales bacterium]
MTVAGESGGRSRPGQGSDSASTAADGCLPSDGAGPPVAVAEPPAAAAGSGSSAGGRVGDHALPTEARHRQQVRLVNRLFGSVSYFRLWLAMLASGTGDWLGFLAIADLAARLGGDANGALAVGFVFMARMVPGLLFGALVGVAVDRFDRFKVMVVCDVARAGVLLALPFVDSVPGLIVASLLMELFTLAWQPAKEATVPNLVPPSHLASANSLGIVAGYGTFPLAAALFAVLSKVGEGVEGDLAATLRMDHSSSLGFYVDSLTFVVSALVIWRLGLAYRARLRPAAKLAAPSRTGERTAVPSAGAGLGAAWTDLKAGWSVIATDPVVRAVNVGLATGLVGGGMLVPLGAIFIDRVLGAGSAGFGLFLTVLGVGVASGVLAVSLTQARLPKARTFASAVFGSGLCLFLATSTTTLTAAALLIFALGLCAGAAYVLGFTLLHESVNDELRGRIFSALNTLVRLCLVTAFAIAPLLTQLLDQLVSAFTDSGRINLGGWLIAVPGVRLTLWLAALIMMAAGALAARSLGWGPRARNRTST